MEVALAVRSLMGRIFVVYQRNVGLRGEQRLATLGVDRFIASKPGEGFDGPSGLPLRYAQIIKTL